MLFSNLQFGQSLMRTACLCSTQYQLGWLRGWSWLSDFLPVLPSTQTGRQRAGAKQLAVLGQLFSMCSVLMVSPAQQFQVSWISYMSTQVSQGFCTDGGRGILYHLLRLSLVKYTSALPPHLFIRNKSLEPTHFQGKGKLEFTLL